MAAKSKSSPKPSRQKVDFSDTGSSWVRARFDSQFTTDENKRHFALADALSVDASSSWQVRRLLRMRNRYEYHNNSYYMGLADTIGDYVIGVGPKLQMTIPNQPKLNARIEKSFNEWAEEIGLGDTLKTSRVARVYNGESFQLLRNNPGLESAVKLDVFEIECDQVTSPMFGMYPSAYPDQFFDGVVLSKWGRPIEYHVLRQHPGAFGAFVLMPYQFDKWPARYVIHDYKKIRPFQQRGIPEATPALPLFAFLREYTLAVLGAADTAADFAMVAETTLPPDPDAEISKPMATAELRRRMLTFLPEGYKLNQVKAEQPTTTYEMFTNAILREISRCLQVPLMFTTLDATQANMSSAYVVTQPFVKSVQKDRAGYNKKLNHILDEWLTEAVKIPGLLPDVLPEEFPHVWRWPKIATHADPSKVAQAHDVSLRNGSTSIPIICGDAGDDWEEVQASAAQSLGMTLDEYRAALRQQLFPPPQAANGKPKAGKDEPANDSTED